MSELTIKGKLIKKFEAQTFGESFRKIEFVIETDDKYPQKIKMQATQDNIKTIEELPEGTICTMHFNVRGREWTSKENKVMYFVSLDVWRVEDNGTDLADLSTMPTTSVSNGNDLPF